MRKFICYQIKPRNNDEYDVSLTYFAELLNDGDIIDFVKIENSKIEFFTNKGRKYNLNNPQLGWEIVDDNIEEVSDCSTPELFIKNFPEYFI